MNRGNPKGKKKRNELFFLLFFFLSGRGGERKGKDVQKEEEGEETCRFLFFNSYLQRVEEEAIKKGKEEALAGRYPHPSLPFIQRASKQEKGRIPKEEKRGTMRQDRVYDQLVPYPDSRSRSARKGERG